MNSDYAPDEMKKYLTQANTSDAFAQRKGSDDSRRWAMAKLTSFTQAGQQLLNNSTDFNFRNHERAKSLPRASQQAKNTHIRLPTAFLDSIPISPIRMML